MSRKSGYYWVILKDTTKWRMGFWNGVNWRIYGHNAMLDKDFSEIDPNPIVREEGNPRVEVYVDGYLNNATVYFNEETITVYVQSIDKIL